MEQGTLGRAPDAHVQPAPPAQALEPDVQAHLGRQLRAVYDEMANQPVPDRFIQLLDALEQKSKRVPDAAPAVTRTTTKVGGA